MPTQFAAASHLHWSVDPILIKLGPLQIHWYGLLFAAAFLIGLQLMSRIYRREGQPEQALGILFYYLLFGTIIGARLGHCLFYDPEFYLANPIEILKIWKGGLASHGGAVGLLTSVYLYWRRHPAPPFLWLLDRLVIPASIGGALVRIGNLFNSEIVGTVTDVPWALVFTRVDLLPRHPVQLYESVTYALIFVLLWFLYARVRAGARLGLLTGVYLVTIFSARFVLEFFKSSQAAFEENLVMSVGQLLSIPMVTAGLILLFFAWRGARASAASRR